MSPGVFDRLYRVGLSMQASGAREDRVRAFMQGVREVLGFDRVLVMLATADGTAFEVESLVMDLEASFPGQVPISPEAGVFHQAFEGRRPIVALNDDDLARVRRMGTAYQGHPIFRTTRFVIAPLVVGDRVLGVAGVDNKPTSRPIDPASVEPFTLLCQQLATSLEHARLLGEVEYQRLLLDVANRHTSQFLATMSHELRTPLNAVLGYTSLLRDGHYGDVSEGIRDVLERIDTNGTHLLDRINEVLDRSIEAGHVELAAIPFSLTELVERTTEIFAVRAHRKHLALACHVTPDVPAAVVGDPSRLRQVLVNLLGNAIKFTEHGDVTVRVEPDPHATEPGALRCSVSDTGIGIPADMLGTILERFAPGDIPVTHRHGGPGLGLMISRHLVELMGGALTITSEAGRGSTFSFTLRLRPEQRLPMAEREAAPVDREATAAPSSAGSRPLRILLVEDSRDNRVLIEAYVKTMPWRLDVAEDGRIAVEKFATDGPYDLVLMDMQMPVMDGYAATRVIREWERARSVAATPVIALTAYARKEEIDKSLAAGCTTHLSKPVRRTALLDTIQRVTGP